MIAKTCGFCGKHYQSKNVRQIYCSKKCTDKAFNKRRMERYRTDEKYRNYILQKKKERFKERYYNELGYKEKHSKQTMEYAKKRYNEDKKFREKAVQHCRNSREKHKDEWNETRKEKYQNNELKRKKINEQNMKNYNVHRDERLKKLKEYRQTENGKLADAKKYNKRKRKYKFIPLWTNPFPKEIQVDYHHFIDNILVIPIPKITHQYVGGASKQNHLDHNDKWIKKLYLFDIKQLYIL